MDQSTIQQGLLFDGICCCTFSSASFGTVSKKGTDYGDENSVKNDWPDRNIASRSGNCSQSGLWTRLFFVHVYMAVKPIKAFHYAFCALNITDDKLCVQHEIPWY